MLNIYPWQQTAWSSLMKMKQVNRLPHALLLVAQAGSGLDQFINCFIRVLFCQHSDANHSQACGQCEDCKWLENGFHPDHMVIKPEEGSKQIKIDQVRNMIQYTTLKSHCQKAKVIVITEAEAMNRNTANALLKVLEEPPEQSLLILLCDHPDKLLPTIKSRCQKLIFNHDANIVFNWLKEQLDDQQQARALYNMAGGAPLAALALAEQNIIQKRQALLDNLKLLYQAQLCPIKAAKTWREDEPRQIIIGLSALCYDMILLKLKVDFGRIVHQDFIQSLQILTDWLKLEELIGAYDMLTRQYMYLLMPNHYNPTSILEEISLYWQQLNRS